MTEAVQREPAILRRRQVGPARGSPAVPYVKKGVFPKPVKLGLRAVGWIESEVSTWFRARARALRTPEHDSA